VKIFVFSDGVRHGCYVYREEIPLEALERRGHVITGGLQTTPIDGGLLADVDLFVFPRLAAGDYPLVIDEIKRHDRPLVYEMDDAADLFERHHTSYFQVQNLLPSYYFLLKHADLVTTTTPHLAEHLRSLGAKRVEVLPNCPPPHITWADPPQNAKVRIGYTGWTAHVLDAAFWFEVMAALWQERQDFTPVLFGISNTSDATGEDWMERCRQAVNQNPLPNAEFGASLKRFRKAWEPLRDVLEWHPMVPVDDYWAKLAALKLDIGCAPLLDTPFNRCKSAVKFYDYAVSGAVTVASAVLPYSQEPTVSVSNRVDAWVDMLVTFLDDAERRRRVLAEQRRWIRANRDADQWAVTRGRLYESVLKGVPA